MGKRINHDAIAIKKLLSKGYTQVQICRILGLKKQKVSYWANNPLNMEIHRRTKLNEEYKKKIVELAQNKLTSDMGSRKIAEIINRELKDNNVCDSQGKILSIEKTAINRYLKSALGKPRKVRRVFYLNEKQKKERLKFCEDILDKKIKGDQIFFTDETKIDMAPFINDSIRLSRENQEKLKSGDEEVFKLINKPEKKFEKSIMIAAGVHAHGLSDLYILEGTMNEFSYSQALYFYKDIIEEIKKNNIIQRIFFEQDGAKPHTSFNNKKLLENLFGKNVIQNPPNSPDLAYPIETLWAFLKKNVKKRLPKNLDELKKFTIEEWNNIPEEYTEKLVKNYIKRVMKVIEIKGNRLEPYHLNDIRTQEENEEKEKKCEEKSNNKIKKMKKDKKRRILKIKKIYNDKNLIKLRNKEIRELKKEKKGVTRKYKKTKIRNVNSRKRLEKEDIDKKIKELKEMTLVEYLQHIREEKEGKLNWNKKYHVKNDEELEEDEETIDTIDETINKILRLSQFIEKNKVKYKVAFKKINYDWEEVKEMNK